MEEKLYEKEYFIFYGNLNIWIITRITWKLGWKATFTGEIEWEFTKGMLEPLPFKRKLE